MRILLVWNNIPDFIAVYDLEIDEEKFARWSKAHGVCGVYGGTKEYNEQKSIIEEIATEIAKIKPIYPNEYDSSKPDEVPILLQEYSALIITGCVFL